MIMNPIQKQFLVRLRDATQMVVEAQSYRREGHQYVFDGTASGEVEFVNADAVISITVVPPDLSQPIEPEEI
jgi:hypothetical protein